MSKMLVVIALVMAGIFILARAFYVLDLRGHANEQGPGAAALVLPTTPPARGVGTLPSTPAVVPPAAPSASGPASPAGVVYYPDPRIGDFSEEMQPTADGLFARTVALWSCEDFLTLSEDEARALLPIADDMGFRGPDSFVTLVGGLPTREDCDAATRDEFVMCALETTCAAEMVFRQLQMLPPERHGAGYPEAVRRALSAYERSEELLMATLDARTRFQSWTLLWKAYGRWSE